MIWWVFTVQGILAILFGGAALLWTSLVVDLVAYFIGALFILYSISTVIRGIRGSGKHRTGLVVIGLLGILIGIFAVVHIYVLWITIGILIAIWALLTGLGDLWLALAAQKGGSFRALLFVAGVLSLLLGFTVGLFPALGYSGHGSGDRYISSGDGDSRYCKRAPSQEGCTGIGIHPSFLRSFQWNSTIFTSLSGDGRTRYIIRPASSPPWRRNCPSPEGGNGFFSLSSPSPPSWGPSMLPS